MSAQRRVRKIPLSGVEAKALVDHHRLIARTARLGKKNRLAPVGVAGPLVKHQHAGEIRQVLHLAQRSSGRKSCTASRAGSPGIARAELLVPPGKAPAPRPVASPVRPSARSDLARTSTTSDSRHRQPHPRRQPSSKHFVRQNANVLRIILELDDVLAAVIAAHQVRLRAAAHATDVLYRQQHGKEC